MEKVKDYVSLIKWRNEIIRVGGEGEEGRKYLDNQVQALLDTKTLQNSARAALIDILEDHEGTGTISRVLNPAIKSLWDPPIKSGIPMDYTDNRMETDEKLWQINKVLWEGDYWPSIFQDGNRRKSYAHLIKVLHDRQAFGKATYEEIAGKLFSPYTVFDGGGETKVAFKSNEMKARGVLKEDFLDSVNYLVLRALKQGHKLYFKHGDHVEPLHPKTVEMMKDDIVAGGGSIWTGVQHSSDGKGIEAVIMSGNREDKSSRKMIGRWMIKNKEGDLIPLSARGEDMWKVLTSYKRGNFMDIDNDDEVYKQVEQWVDKYGEDISKVTNKKYIPKGLEEISVVDPDRFFFNFFDIGKFEYEEVVKPFWDKYGPKGENLTPEEFADKWEEVRLEETYAWEDKYFRLGTWGLVDPYHPFIGPGIPAYPLDRETQEQHVRNINLNRFLKSHGKIRPTVNIWDSKYAGEGGKDELLNDIRGY